MYNVVSYDDMLVTTNMQSSHENRTELIQTDADEDVVDEDVVDEDVADEDLKRTTTEILSSEIVQRSNIAAKGKQNGTSILETTEEQVIEVDVDVDDSNETKNSSLEIQSVHSFSANTSRYRLKIRHQGIVYSFYIATSQLS